MDGQARGQLSRTVPYMLSMDSYVLHREASRWQYSIRTPYLHHNITSMVTDILHRRTACNNSNNNNNNNISPTGRGLHTSFSGLELDIMHPWATVCHHSRMEMHSMCLSLQTESDRQSCTINLLTCTTVPLELRRIRSLPPTRRSHHRGSDIQQYREVRRDRVTGQRHPSRAGSVVEDGREARARPRS